MPVKKKKKEYKDNNKKRIGKTQAESQEIAATRQL